MLLYATSFKDTRFLTRMQAYHEAYCADTVYSTAIKAIVQDVVRQLNANTLDQLLKPSGVQLCSRTLMFPPVFVVCNCGLLPANTPDDFMDVLKRRVNSELRNQGFLTVGSVAYTTLVS